MRIGWALVNYGPIFSPVYASHLRAIAHASRTMAVEQLGGVFACGATDRMYQHSAANQAIKDFLATDCTHLFMTESDMLLPDDTLSRLAEVNKPIVSGVYFIRGGDGQPCLYKPVVRVKGQYGMSPVGLFPEEAPFRLNGCPGVGCVLIAREVFEQVPFPWFDLNAVKYGSDMYFYSNCLDAGLEVWIQPAVMCGQIEYKVWSVADYHDRLQQRDNPLQGYILGVGA